MAVFSCPDQASVPDGVVFDAIGYYRLSKFNKNTKSESITNQKKLIHEYVARHPEIRLVDEKEDKGYTGTNYDRPGFQAVMDAVNSGRVNCVIVKDLSRLGREYIETGKYLEMVFPALGVRFISINDDIDSDVENDANDLLIPVKNIMNETYCRELSRKLRRQFRLQRSNGEFMGAFTCYGYRKDADDKHRLVIDDYAAEVVRGIFQLKMKGYSNQAIADYLNHEGVLSPICYKRQLGLNYKSGFTKAGTGKWGPMAIRNILTNPVYVGTLVQGKRGTPNYKVKQIKVRSEKEWSVVEKNHEPIIDQLIFLTVQQMLQRDTRTSPLEETVQPLGGVLFCADCKRAMCRRSVKRGSKVFYYYVCSTSKRGGACSSHSFSQKKLEDIVLRAIQKQIEIVVELDALLAQIGQSDVLAVKLKGIDMQYAEKNQELDNYREFRMKLLETLHDGLIERSEYDMMHKKYTKLIETTEKAMAALNERRETLVADSASERTWMAKFAKYRNVQTLTRDMVVNLIDKIYVYEDKRIQIDFNYKDEIVYYQAFLQRTAMEVG